MTLQFPKTFEAAKRAEKGQWALGDALIKEVGPSDQADRAQAKRFEAAAKELTEGGMPYSTSHLKMLRNLAAKFASERQRSDVSTEVAREAGSPEVLEAHRKTGKPVTKREVRQTRKAVQKSERKAKQKASGRSEKTLPKKGAATKPTPPTKSQLSHLREGLEFQRYATEALVSAEKAEKLVDRDWDDEEAEENRHFALEAANAWHKVADQFTGQPSRAKRSERLSVVGERG